MSDITAASLDVTGSQTLSGTHEISTVTVGSMVAATDTVPFAQSIAGDLSLVAGAALATDGLDLIDGCLDVDSAVLTVSGPTEIGGGSLTVTAGGTISADGAITETAGTISVTGALSRLNESGTLTLGAALSAVAPSLGASAGASIQIVGITTCGAVGTAILSTDAASSIEVGFAGGAAPGAVTVDPGATLNPRLDTEIIGNLIDFGTILVGAGTFSVSGATNGDGTLLLGSGTTWLTEGNVAGVTFDFAGADASLEVGPTSEVAAELVGFGAGDDVILDGIAATSANWANGTLDVFDDGVMVDALALAGSFISDSFLVGPTTGTGSSITLAQAGGAGHAAATADAEIWTGGAGGLWNSAANWADTASATEPAPGFPAGLTAATIDGASATAYTEIAGGGDAGSLAVTGLVALDGSYDFGSLAVGTESFSTSVGVTTATVTAGSLWLGNGVAVSTGSLAVLAGELLIDAPLATSGGVSVGTPSGLLIPNGAGFDATAGSSGMITIGIGGSLSGDTVELVQGSLAIDGGAASVASVTLGIGADESANGSVTLATDGELSLSAGGSLTVSGTMLEIDGTINVDGVGSQLVEQGFLTLQSTLSGPSLDVTHGGRVQVGGIVTAGSGLWLVLDAASAIEIGFAGDTAAGAITIDAGASFSATTATAVDGNLVDDGSIFVDAGTFAVEGSLAGGGSIWINGGASLATGGAVSGNDVGFAGANAGLVLGATFTGSITGFAVTDRIELDTLTATSATWHSNVLTLLDGTTLVGSLDLVGAYGTDHFAVSAVDGGSEITLLAGPAGAVRDDFSGDGKSAILWQNVDGAPAIWLMNGLLPVATQQLANPGSTWHVVTAGDFTADGLADLLWQNDDGMVAIWNIDGVTPIGYGLVANPGTAWHVMGTGDFAGNGYSDILFQNDDGTPAIWEMYGTSIVASAQLADAGPTWHVMGSGDFSGDGFSDILWQNDDGMVAIWEMHGLTPIATSDVANPGTAWHIVATGDFNADGQSDILFRNDNGTVAIWEMDGFAIAASAELGNPGSQWHVVGSGDYNGDGHADILFQNNDGTAAIWEMNGLTPIATAEVANVPLTWQTIGPGTTHFINGTQSTGTIEATILNDDFVFTSSSLGAHVIAGFDPVHDVLTLSTARFGSYIAFAAAETTVNGAMTVALGGGATLTLSGVSIGALTEKNVILS